HLKLELSILGRESVTGANHDERVAETTAALKAAEDRLAGLEARWESEKKLVAEIQDVRDALEEAHAKAGKEGDGRGSPGDAALREKLDARTAELRKLQGESPLMQVCVDAQTVAEVIAGWTGIPVGKMLADEIKTVLNLHAKLEERVIGQSH